MRALMILALAACPIGTDQCTRLKNRPITLTLANGDVIETCGSDVWPSHEVSESDCYGVRRVYGRDLYLCGVQAVTIGPVTTHPPAEMPPPTDVAP